MVMAFNPDDPHDGQATDGFGFTYRMIHIGPELVSTVLADAAGRPVGLPLFADPVLSDPVLAARLRRLHGALLGGATALRRDELLTAAWCWPRRGQPRSRAGRTDPPRAAPPRRPAAGVAGRTRDLIARPLPRRHHRRRPGRRHRPQPVRGAPRVHATSTGCSPSDYQRQLRLREARALIAAGHADQRGRGPRRVRRPEPPVPLVRPLLRRHPRPLPARRAHDRAGALRSDDDQQRAGRPGDRRRRVRPDDRDLPGRGGRPSVTVSAADAAAADHVSRGRRDLGPASGRHGRPGRPLGRQHSRPPDSSLAAEPAAGVRTASGLQRDPATQASPPDWAAALDGVAAVPPAASCRPASRPAGGSTAPVVSMPVYLDYLLARLAPGWRRTRDYGRTFGSLAEAVAQHRRRG